MTRGSTLGLRDEPEEGAVTVEAPGPAVLDDFKAGLVMAVEKLVRHLAAGSLVRQLKCLGPEPLHADYRRQGVRASGRQGVREDSANGGVWLEILEFHRLLLSPPILSLRR